jgi:hypothetical protein
MNSLPERTDITLLAVTVEEQGENDAISILPPAFTLVSFSAYFSTLKIVAICSSETSLDFQRTIRRYILEDSTLRMLRCLIQNLSYCFCLYMTHIIFTNTSFLCAKCLYVIQLDGGMTKQALYTLAWLEILLPNRGYIRFMSCIYAYFA